MHLENPARTFDIDASKYVPVYAYEFNDPNSPGILPPVSFPLLAAHTHEIQYVWPGWKGVFPGQVAPFTNAQQNLSKDMIRAWGTFAEKGAPASSWPNFTQANNRWVSLQVGQSPVISNFGDDHKCSLWDSFRNPNV
jgi:para-nitrobenzyl esterase